MGRGRSALRTNEPSGAVVFLLDRGASEAELEALALFVAGFMLSLDLPFLFLDLLPSLLCPLALPVA